MNCKQELAIQLATAGHNIFVTGHIGTGKTHTVKAVIQMLRQQGRQVDVTASTGLASKQIKVPGASTIHHWAGMRDNRYTNEHLLELLENDITLKSSRDRIIKVDTLVIDEISMISAQVLDQLEFVCRSLRRSNKLFGGIQIIVSGDFGQLPPVPNESYSDAGHFCFISKAWQLALPSCHVVILDQVMRQHEPEMVTAIRELALGELSNETTRFLSSLSRPLANALEHPIYLYARNFQVEMTNYDHLREFHGEETSYYAKQDGAAKYLSSCQAPQVLVLKPGCRVMLVANITPNFVNGSLGNVAEVRQDSCIVDFDEVGRLHVKPYLFTTFSRREGHDIASRLQLPIRLAYAITIHKAQGMSLHQVVVDARKANKPGQLATAVGRATSKDGLQLLHFNSNEVPKQLNSVKTFLISCSDGDSTDCDDLHHTCCKNKSFLDAAVDIPNTVLPDGHDDDDVYVDNDGDDDDDDDDDDVMNAFMDVYDTAMEEETSLDESSPDLAQLRKDVQEDFMAGETPDQVEMRDSDRDISDNIDQYLTSQWCTLNKLFRKNDNVKKLKHKDFSDFIAKCDQHFMSPEHDNILRLFLFKHHTLNAIERRLVHKYQLQLQQRFLAMLALKETSKDAHLAAVSKDVEPSDLSKAGIRYLAGMCFAKAKYRQSCIALHNVHKFAERVKVQQARLRVDLLETHTRTQTYIQQNTKAPQTLLLTVKKQNLREGLTHVSDEVFQYFETLDKELSHHVTRANFNMHKGEIFVVAEKNVRSCRALHDSWKALFPGCPDHEFLLAMMQYTITPYIHVRCNQFRKDMVSSLRDVKTLEIRKAVWNSTGKRKPPSTRKSTSKTTGKKSNMTTQKRKARSDQDCAGSTSDTICPICGVQYWDRDVWVGCDNDACGTFVCRKCAHLEDDDIFKAALDSYWTCPLC